MSRTVIVGDVHGCCAELKALLAEVGFEAGDRLVMVGDLVTRGPDPAGLVERCCSRWARARCAATTDHLLRWRRRPSAASGPPTRPWSRRSRSDTGRTWSRCRSGSTSRSTASAWCTPASSRGCRSRSKIPDPHVRTLSGPDRKASARRARRGALWGARYTGPPHVVFGHNAMPEPQIHADATGLDTWRRVWPIASRPWCWKRRHVHRPWKSGRACSGAEVEDGVRRDVKRAHRNSAPTTPR